MLAISIEEHGGPETLRPVHIPEPEPGPGQVLVRHEAIGVNFVDTQHRVGAPYPVELPLIPGIEAAGHVDAVGEGVDEFTAGDRVAYGGPMAGVYAEAAAVPAAAVVSVPDGVSSEIAAATLLQGMTAHVMTHDVYSAVPGEGALVHAAAGGTGSLIVQFLLAGGVNVIGSTSSPAKAAYVRTLGAQHVVDYRESDLVSEVHRISPGGVDVVFDSVGRSTFEASLRSVRPRGLIVAFGQSSGPVEPFDPARLSGLTGEGLPGSLVLAWPTLNDHNASRQDLVARAAAVFEAVRDGVLAPTIAEVLPLEEAGRAHQLLESRAVVGKVLLRP